MKLIALALVALTLAACTSDEKVRRDIPEPPAPSDPAVR